jgi:hypothetical protein
MRQVSCRSRRKVGVALQITAMVMLLCTPHLPLLAHSLDARLQPGHCAMDHRICGCAPERIATRTCCCFRNMKHAAASVKPGFCHLAKAHAEPDTDNDTPPASHKLSSLPCGSKPQMISQVTSEMKYLRSIRVPLPMYRSAPHNIPSGRDSYLSPSLEPLVPPPKISIFV